MIPVIVTLIVASLGGAVFYLIGIPLAWMLGAYCSTAVSQFLIKSCCFQQKISLSVPAQARHLSFPLIGIAIGLRFESGFLDQLSLWMASLSIMLVQTCVILGLSYWILRHYLQFPKMTAFLSAIPGGMTETILTAQTYQLDQQTVSVMQILRIIFTVTLLPFLILAFAVPTRPIALSAGEAMPVLINVASYHLDSITWEWAGLICAALLLAYICWLLMIPAAHLLGPILLGMVLSGYQAWDQIPPNWMIPMAQIVIGATIGTRFATLPLLALARLVMVAAAMAALITLISAVFAAITAWYFQIAYFPILLSYIPGGMTEISVVSLTLDLEAPFITSHHIVRVIFLLIGVNLFVRYWQFKKQNLGEKITDMPDRQ